MKCIWTNGKKWEQLDKAKTNPLPTRTTSRTQTGIGPLTTIILTGQTTPIALITLIDLIALTDPIVKTGPTKQTGPTEQTGPTKQTGPTEQTEQTVKIVQIAKSTPSANEMSAIELAATGKNVEDGQVVKNALSKANSLNN